MLTLGFAFDEAFVAVPRLGHALNLKRFEGTYEHDDKATPQINLPLTTSASRLSPPQTVTGGGWAETSGTPPAAAAAPE